MKVSNKSRKIQRALIDNKVKSLSPIREVSRPRSGWLKAVREALGISARQVADQLDISYQAVLRLEQAEANHAVTFDSMIRYANAMDCIFVYAVIPKSPRQSLDDILEVRADGLARKIFKQVSHTMRLEDQGVDAQNSEQQISDLKDELKKSMDPRLWEVNKSGR
jgi:predicted DNA-binding mobile mystery protein A